MSSNAFAKISVIVPVYNVEQYLPQCLDSLITQTYSNLEIICVNDGSTDQSSSILNKYREKDARIKIIKQANRGLGAARNIGLESATGAYISFIDSDDWCEPCMLEKMYFLLEESEVDFVICGITSYDDQTGLSTQGLTSFLDIEIGKSLSQEHLHANFLSYSVSACNKLYRKYFLNTHNLRFPEGVLFEDVPFYVDLCMLASSFSILNEPMYIYRTNRENSIVNNPYDKDIYRHIENYKYLLDKMKLTGIFEENKLIFWNHIFKSFDIIMRRLQPENRENFYQEARSFILETQFSGSLKRQSRVLHEQWKDYYRNKSYKEWNQDGIIWKKIIKKSKIKYYFFGISFLIVLDNNQKYLFGALRIS